MKGILSSSDHRRTALQSLFTPAPVLADTGQIISFGSKRLNSSVLSTETNNQKIKINTKRKIYLL
jgi:hypothetical protein